MLANLGYLGVDRVRDREQGATLRDGVDAGGEQLPMRVAVAMTDKCFREFDPMIQIEIDELGRTNWREQGPGPDVGDVDTVRSSFHLPHQTLITLANSLELLS